MKTEKKGESGRPGSEPLVQSVVSSGHSPSDASPTTQAGGPSPHPILFWRSLYQTPGGGRGAAEYELKKYTQKLPCRNFATTQRPLRVFKPKPLSSDRTWPQSRLLRRWREQPG